MGQKFYIVEMRFINNEEEDKRRTFVCKSGIAMGIRLPRQTSNNF